jgi:glycosyltransferase involved in cell wall biosynthesis
MATHRVTVLVDTYNHERFIEEALASVVEQDFPAAEMEVLVVDDGSTDRTPEIVKKFEPRVRLIRKANGGQASAFNAGIAEARGEILAFLDGDDWWARNKLARVTEAMAAEPALGIVGHGIVVVQMDGRQQSETLREGFRFRANTREGARLFRLRKSQLGTSRMAIRRDLLERIGSVPETLRIEADEYLFTLAAAMAEAQILPEALTFYRLHEGNSYQFSQRDAEKARRKQAAVAALVDALTKGLERAGLEAAVRREITEIIQAEADQLRLSLEGGWPWETVKAEWTIDRVLHPAGTASHRAFKALSLLPALALPPRLFYGMRQKIAEHGAYDRFRTGRWVAKAELPHLERN